MNDWAVGEGRREGRVGRLQLSSAPSLSRFVLVKRKGGIIRLHDV